MDNEREYIGEAILKYCSRAPSSLMGNHGAFAWVATPRAALKAAVMTEDVAKTVWLTKQIGEPNAIPPEEAEKWYDRYHNRYGQSGSGSHSLVGTKLTCPCVAGIVVREKRQGEASWWVLYSLSLAGLMLVATDPILRPALLGSYGLLALIALITLAGILIFANVISLSVRELAVSMLGFAILGVIYFMSLRYWGSSAWPEGERKTYGEYPYKYIEALAFAAPFAVIAADCIFRVRWWLSTVTWLLSMWMTLVTVMVFWAD